MLLQRKPASALTRSRELTSSRPFDPASVFPNSITRSKTEKRTYIADELDECRDYGGLFMKLAFEKGILNNWEVEKTVWDRVWGKQGRGLKIDPTTTSLLLTEPVMNLPNVQDQYDQMIFEEYDFKEYLRCPASSFIPYGETAQRPNGSFPECVLVVDSGFSFTHVTPYVRGQIVSSGVRRIDVGGKLLTNHLKELVSFRQWYMMDQTHVIERVKETCCYVSNEWEKDWELANVDSPDTSIVRTYVLPDFVPTSSNKLGYLRVPPTGFTPPPTPPPIDEPSEINMDIDPPAQPKGKGKEKVVEEEQLLQMSNERFTVPEVLFNPSSIGFNQSGLAETILHSINSLPVELQGMFWNNIICTGGNSGFEGFKLRLESSLRPLAPSSYPIRVSLTPSPTLSPILSAPSALKHSPVLAKENFLTRAEYQELGSAGARRRKFAGRVYGGKEEVEGLGS